jgi:polyisoprenoid-binding protein YceI
MNNSIKHIFCASLLLILSSQATAFEFNTVQPNESSVSFGYTQMGVPMDGKFNQFSAQILFDPDKLDKAQARIDITLASIDTGVDEANEEVAGKLWFNTKDFPSASFVASGIKALGGNQYEASGKLTIKGRTLDIKTPLTFQATGANGQFDGAFVIKRLDYGIGEGMWRDVSAVADEIKIKFHLAVKASPAKK